MNEFIAKVLAEGTHRKIYEVVVGAEELGDFINGLVTQPGVLYSFSADYHVWDDKAEYVVTFTVWDNGATENN